MSLSDVKSIFNKLNRLLNFYIFHKFLLNKGMQLSRDCNKIIETF